MTVKKMSKMSNLILTKLYQCNNKKLTNLFKCYIRPILEYGYLIYLIEYVQRNFTYAFMV